MAVDTTFSSLSSLSLEFLSRQIGVQLGSGVSLLQGGWYAPCRHADHYLQCRNEAAKVLEPFVVARSDPFGILVQQHTPIEQYSPRLRCA